MIYFYPLPKCLLPLSPKISPSTSIIYHTPHPTSLPAKLSPATTPATTSVTTPATTPVTTPATTPAPWQLISSPPRSPTANEEEDFPEIVGTEVMISEEECMNYDGRLAMIEVEEIEPSKVDTSHFFQTDQTFKTEDEAVNWLQSVGRDLKIVLVRGRSDFGKNRNAYIKYNGERGGPLRNHHKAYKKKIGGKGKRAPRKSFSKKCGCEFLLLLRQDKKLDYWKVSVLNGFHNHSLADSNLGHSFMGRLNADERELVSRLTKIGTQPKVIRKELKDLNPNNYTPAQTIYNERVKLKKTFRENRTVMQEVFHKARESDVFLRYNKCKETVENLFWAPKKSLLLAKKFPYVLMMDCTYKTNFYKLPLLQIVGVSSTNITFSVAFAYLASEKKENYEWALRQLKEALSEKVQEIKVIITDRELALMDAIQFVIPEASHILCRWHIEKAIRAHIRKGMNDFECDEIIRGWNRVVYSETNEELALTLQGCKEMVSDEIFNYLDSTWVSPYKEKFVSLWTNNVFHLGHTQTSRVEGAHASLKNWLGTSNCDMATGWSAISSMCEQQFRSIEASFEISKTKWSINQFGGNWCRYLRGVISLHALTLVKDAFDTAKDFEGGHVLCGCVIRKTHGLPCAHEIGAILRERDSLPRSLVHDIWKTLSMEGEVPLEDETLDPHPHIQEFLRIFHSSSKVGQFELIQRLKEVNEPECTTLSQPTVKLNTRGRPKKIKANKVDDTSTRREPSLFEHVEEAATFAESQTLKKELKVNKEKVKMKRATSKSLQCTPESSFNPSPYLVHIPSEFRAFVNDIVDVKPDGNCGYRAVAVALGRHEDEWPDIRKELYDELQNNIGHYDKLFQEKGSTLILLKKVKWPSGSCRSKHWMSSPTMLWPIAERYNVVVSIFSEGIELTCFPTKQPPLADVPSNIALMFRGSHYVCVNLKDNCPLPPPMYRWSLEASSAVRDAWLAKYGSRLVQVKMQETSVVIEL